MATMTTTHGWIGAFKETFGAVAWTEKAGGARLVTPDGSAWLTSFWWHGRRLPANGELQCYTDPYVSGSAPAPMRIDPFSIANGSLAIRADRAPAAALPHLGGLRYISGMINTFGCFAQDEGIVEARMKVPAGRGLWSAFYLLPADGGWPPEIDMMEVLGHEPASLHMAVHSAASGRHEPRTVTQAVGDLSQAFHVYGVHWDRREIVWRLDGQPRLSLPTPDDLKGRRLYLVAQLAVGGHWPGPPDATTPFPAELQIDYVRAFQRRLRDEACPKSDIGPASLRKPGHARTTTRRTARVIARPTARR